MFFSIPKYYPDTVINIPIRTASKQRIRVKVSNANPAKPNTVYFDSDPVINGVNEFDIKIPKFPNDGVVLEVYNEANGHDDRDNSFQLGRTTPKKLDVPLKNIKNKVVKAFLDFSDDLSEDAGWLPAQNKIYYSPDKTFRVDYKDVIRDDDGKELATPARVNSASKIIEISRKYYVNFTVPQRKAINLHEFSHVYINDNPADEFEADKWAIKIYLSGGNSTIDAIKGFLRTFQNTPSDLNVKRYAALMYTITHFDKNNFII